MDDRLNLFENQMITRVARQHGRHGPNDRRIGLPPATQQLVKLRTSQINGCGPCTDMHAKEATAEGESQSRLNLAAVWREATVVTEAGRAAKNSRPFYPPPDRPEWRILGLTVTGLVQASKGTLGTGSPPAVGLRLSTEDAIGSPLLCPTGCRAGSC
jgi:AhpD family alkylhydroperoxidase